MRFQDLNLRSIGNGVTMVGTVFSGEGKALLCLFPNEELDGQIETLEMTTDEWKVFLRQSDTVEFEILRHAADGTITKAIMRKSERHIDGNVQWRVFKRDGYACRYCGADDVPLSVDHLVLFKDGGPNDVENLVSSCKKCNKVRGDLPYEEWLRHPRYKAVSKNLSPEARAANEAVIGTLGAIKRVDHLKGR